MGESKQTFNQFFGIHAANNSRYFDENYYLVRNSVDWSLLGPSLPMRQLRHSECWFEPELKSPVVSATVATPADLLGG